MENSVVVLAMNEIELETVVVDVELLEVLYCLQFDRFLLYYHLCYGISCKENNYLYAYTSIGTYLFRKF